VGEIGLNKIVCMADGNVRTANTKLSEAEKGLETKRKGKQKGP